MIASGSRDGTVILWNLALDDLLVRGCNVVRDYLKSDHNVEESDRTLVRWHRHFSCRYCGEKLTS
jgi:hypothetical protein